MKNLNDQRVLVFGLGVHGGGLGVAQWLVKQGAIGLSGKKAEMI